jgi:hypothetical protein
MKNISWCQIFAIGKKHVFGHTTDGDVVLVPKTYRGMEAVQRGDIVEFTPSPFVAASGSPPPNKTGYEAKFYARNPIIIARFFRAETRDPLAWKKRTESGDEWRDFVEATGVVRTFSPVAR